MSGDCVPHTPVQSSCSLAAATVRRPRTCSCLLRSTNGHAGRFTLTADHDVDLGANGISGCRSYEFDHVFGSRSTQLDGMLTCDLMFAPSNVALVWKEFHPLIQSCVEGYHVTVMSYGQTGSGEPGPLTMHCIAGMTKAPLGKTYTMSGDPRTSTVGLIQRAIICLFDEITKVLVPQHFQGITPPT